MTEIPRHSIPLGTKAPTQERDSKGEKTRRDAAEDREGRSPVMCAEKARLLVLVAHWTEVAADDLEVGVLADIVLGHLEHAEVKVGDWAEGSTGDEDEGLLVRIAEDAGQAVRREGVIWRIREDGWGRWWRGVHV